VSSPAIAPRLDNAIDALHGGFHLGEIGEIGAHDLFAGACRIERRDVERGAAPRKRPAQAFAQGASISPAAPVMRMRFMRPSSQNLMRPADGSNREVLRSGNSIEERARLATHLGWLIPHMKVATSAFSTNRRLEHGQSMSALPRFIRRQFVLLLPKHHPLRRRDIWPCFRFWRGGNGCTAPRRETTSKLLALRWVTGDFCGMLF